MRRGGRARFEHGLERRVELQQFTNEDLPR